MLSPSFLSPSYSLVPNFTALQPSLPIARPAMATGPTSLPVVNKPTIHRGLILTAGGIEVEVFEDQLKELSEAPRTELDERMVNEGVVPFSKELLSVEQLAKLSIVTSTRAHAEMACSTPITFADNHLDGLLDKQVILILLRTTLSGEPFSGRMNPGPQMLPWYMVKLFWKKMGDVAEGVGVGGGAEHEGGGKGAPGVMVEYEYEEEEIEEDTSKQAQHRVSGPGGDASEKEHGVALGERVDKRAQHVPVSEKRTEQHVTGDKGGIEKLEGRAAVHEGGTGGQDQEGVTAAQGGGAGGQEQEGGEATQECCRGDERQVAVTRRHHTASGSGQAGPSTGCPSTAGRSTSAIASEGHLVELLQGVAELEASQKKLVTDVFAKHKSSKSTLKQCADAVNGVMEERKLLEGARTKLDEMSGKVIEGPRAYERLVPPSSSMGGHVGSPVASPPSRARHLVTKSGEDNEVIVLNQSPHPKTSKAAPKPPPDAFAPPRDMLQGLGKKGGKGVVAGEKSGNPIESVTSAEKGAGVKRGAPNLSGGAAGKGAGETWGAPTQVVVAAGLLSKTKADSAAQLGIVGRPVKLVGKRGSSSTPPVAPVAALVLGDVRLSELCSPSPGPCASPSASKKRQAVRKSTKRAAEATESSDVVELGSLLGQAPVKTASTVVAA
ncbi:unnamed protein product [Closterium sp. Yama58-4]|nr:unnamed protein product [Closterium sp. Yama58-4]